MIRCTTRYDAQNDRIRLLGEEANGQTVQVWLTRRLLSLLLPALCRWLEQQKKGLPMADVLLGFEQQCARSALEPQAPVRLQQDSASWMAQSVDVAQQPTQVELCFRGEAGQSSTLTLSVPAMRQWLAIVQMQWQQAQWSAEVWPAWLREAALSAPGQPQVLH